MLSAGLFIMLFILSAGVSVFAEEPIASGDFSYNKSCHWELTDSGNSLKLTVSGTEGAELDGSKPWNKYASSITELVVEPGIRTVGSNQFSGLKKLIKVTLADSITEIQSGCFTYCTALQKIVLPDGISVIDYGVFENCERLKEVSLPAGLKEIKDYAFLNCKRLATIDLPDGLQTIGTNVFTYSGLTGIEIPESIEIIREQAFQNCEYLTEVILPESSFELGMYAFANCRKLKSIYLPRSITKLGENAVGGEGSWGGEITDREGIIYIYFEGTKTEWNAYRYKKGSGQIVYFNASDPASISVPKDVAIYRLYNKTTKEHLWTASKKEYDTLPGYGWTQEGTAWMAPGDGTGVCRLYNPKTKDHHYTSSKNEARTLIQLHGWKYDNGGKPVFRSAGWTPVYRLYNKNFKCGAHHLTKSANERRTLADKYGWKDEGVAFYCVQ